jgi:hypothetical protein
MKMSQQVSDCAGFPILTPLPTYTSQTNECCYAYPISPDQSLSEYVPAPELNNCPVSGRLTPQTPEPLIYHDPLSIGDVASQWADSQQCSDDPFGSTGLIYDVDNTSMLPIELWSAPEHAHPRAAPMTQMNWHQSSLFSSPQITSHELVPHATAVPSLSVSGCSMQDLNHSGNLLEDWSTCHPVTAQLELGGLLASTPFMHNLGSSSTGAPMWEDVFMRGSASY